MQPASSLDNDRLAQRLDWSMPQLFMLLILIQITLEYSLEVAGVSFDYTDILLFFTILCCLFHKDQRYRLLQTPMLFPWLIYGLFLSVSYVYMQADEETLASPARTSYQLYRYCWRFLLYYPLIFVFFQGQNTLKAIVLVVILSTDYAAVLAILDGFKGFRSGGTMVHGNALGGFLLVPLMLCLSLMLYVSNWKEKLFYGASFFLMLRALIFTRSRGAWIAFAFASLCFMLTFLLNPVSRKKIFVMVPALTLATLVMVGTVLLVKPDFFETPFWNRVVTLASPTDVHTFQWRQGRWVHFIGKVIEHPWLGTGQEMDLTLGPNANTPHNGYLREAVVNGIPAFSLFTFFLIVLSLKALRLINRSREPLYTGLSSGIFAGILGLMLHNMVDATFHEKLLWTTFGLVILVELEVEKQYGFLRTLAPVLPAFVRRLAIAPGKPLG